jgi:hypothetical protein
MTTALIANNLVEDLKQEFIAIIYSGLKSIEDDNRYQLLLINQLTSLYWKKKIRLNYLNFEEQNSSLIKNKYIFSVYINQQIP